VEDLPGAAAAREEVDLVGDPGARGVDQIDHGDGVRVRALDDPDDLLDRTGAPGARLDRGVVGHQAHIAPLDPGDSGDHAVGRQAVGECVGVHPVLDERTLVDQQRDPLPREELALGGVGGVVALGAAGQHALAYLRQRITIDRHVTPSHCLNDR
jgi:hypothetical protein